MAHTIDGFRFTLNVKSATQMPTKIFRYRLVPTKVQATASQPPTAIELMGAFDGVCSPADLEDFPEDWPAQNARPAWYRLDFIDLIVRSRSIADQAYAAILFEVELKGLDPPPTWPLGEALLGSRDTAAVADQPRPLGTKQIGRSAFERATSQVPAWVIVNAWQALASRQSSIDG